VPGGESLGVAEELGNLAVAPRPTSSARRNGLIAAAIAIPLTVVLAFALAPNNHSDQSSNSVLAPLTIATPPLDPAAAAQCPPVMEQLPVQLGSLTPRTVHTTPETGQVVAWGNPPVVFTCGVQRPSALAPQSSALLLNIDGLTWLPIQTKNETTFTVIDRAIYIQVTVAKAQNEQPISPLSQAILKVLPKAVCQVQAPGEPAPATDALCTRRK
jgi:hypothetical protein